MGRLVDGVWVTTTGPAVSSRGEFKRAPAVFRNWITPDGAPGPSGTGGHKAESSRYHLYASYACPWAHRTLIFRHLEGLGDHIGVSVVHPFVDDNGWSFSTDFDGATGDQLMGFDYLRDVYLKSDPGMTGRVSVPVLWDSQTQTIVSNESSEIIRMFNSAFDAITGNTLDFWPQDLQAEIEPINDRVYRTLNNGVYRTGFAQTQQAYKDAVTELTDTLDWLEERLARNRYLMGDRLTEADWRLFPTLVRYDSVYHFHFKCNLRRISDMPNLWGYVRELYQLPGIAETVVMDHIKTHYFTSHESVNPLRIVPVGPELNFTAPHQRAALAA
jgi:putative glutathione S-transferase